MHPENLFRISGFEYKKRFFGLWAAGVPRVTRKPSESMLMRTGARIHTVAVHITLPDAEDAYDRRGNNEVSHQKLGDLGNSDLKVRSELPKHSKIMKKQ